MQATVRDYVRFGPRREIVPSGDKGVPAGRMNPRTELQLLLDAEPSAENQCVCAVASGGGFGSRSPNLSPFGPQGSPKMAFDVSGNPENGS